MRKRIVIVLWAGSIGGAETLMGDVAIALRAQDVDATLLFIGDPAPLADRLSREHVPWVSLRHRRGAVVLRHPRRLVETMRELGRDGAIVNATGYLPWLIRTAGYAAPILAVEHGDALNFHTAPFRRRLRVRLERRLCARSAYLDIAVSDTMLAASMRATGRSGKRIYNGVDLERFSPSPRRTQTRGGQVVFGVACRLAPGKGVDVLIDACRLIAPDLRWCLRIAGDGPERGRLQALADQPELRGRVVFEGSVTDMPRFWAACDVAVVASTQWIESFSMAAVEAMACGLPIVASASGALPEICDETCATLVPPADLDALADALGRYVDSRALRRAHAEAGRTRAERLFGIERMVDQYLDALADPASRPRRARPAAGG